MNTASIERFPVDPDGKAIAHVLHLQRAIPELSQLNVLSGDAPFIPWGDDQPMFATPVYGHERKWQLLTPRLTANLKSAGNLVSAQGAALTTDAYSKLLTHLDLALPPPPKPGDMATIVGALPSTMQVTLPHFH